MIRILGGKFRGRKLATPAGRDTRPTAARVREAVFDILEHAPGIAVDWPGLVVLDLFAGSGAFGLEALSRGADAAVLVDNNREAIKALRKNVQTMGLNQSCVVVQSGASTALERFEFEDRAFNLVFLDPPYRDRDRTVNVLKRLDRSRLLAPRARIVWEHPVIKSTQFPKANGCSGTETDPKLLLPELQLTRLQPVACRRWGDTEVLFFNHV